MGLGGVVYKSFRSGARHTGGAGYAQSGCCGGGAAFIFCQDRERCAVDGAIISHQRLYGLIHHFHGSGKSHTGGTGRATGRAASGLQLGVIFRVERYIPGIGEGRTGLIVSDIGFRIGGDGMSPGCTGAAYRAAGQGARRADGGQRLRRVCGDCGAAGVRQSRAVPDARMGVAVIGLDIHRRTDGATAGEGKPTGKAEEFRAALSRDSRRAVHRITFLVGAIGNIKIPLAQVCVGGLLDLIHCHGAGAAKGRCAAGCADGYGLRCAIIFAVLGIAIIGIVRLDGELRDFQRIFLFRVAFYIGLGGAFMNHDADGRPHGTAAGAQCADAGGGGAVIQGGHSRRIHIDAIDAAHFTFHIGNMRLCGGGNFISYRREGAGLLIRHGAGGSHRGNAGLAIGFDRKASLLGGGLFIFRSRHAADVIVFGIRLRIAGHQIHRDGSANGSADAAAGERYRPGVGVQLPFVSGHNGHGLRRVDIAVLRIGFGGIVDLIDGDLARAGDALACAAAAGCHIEHALFVVRQDGERFVLVLLAGERKVCAIHIGLVGGADGVPHEASADGIALLSAHVRRHDTGDGIDGAIVQRADIQGLGGNDGRCISISHMGLRVVGHAIDGKVRGHGQFIFLRRRFTYVAGHGIVRAGHLLHDLIHFVLQISSAGSHFLFPLRQKRNESIDALLLRRRPHMVAPGAGMVRIRPVGAVVGNGAGQRSCSDVTVILRAYSHGIGRVNDSAHVSLCFT